MADKLYPYDSSDVHADLEKGIYAGAYGANNACFLAIAELKSGVDLKEFHSKRTKDESYISEMKELLDNKETQSYWKNIATFDPWGMTSITPTIASTTAILHIPEFKDKPAKKHESKDKYNNNSNDISNDEEKKAPQKDSNINANDSDISNDDSGKPVQLPRLSKVRSLPPKVIFKQDMTVIDQDFGIHCIKSAIHYAWNIPVLSERLELTQQQLRNALFKYTGNPDLLNSHFNTFLPSVGGVTVYIFGDPRKIRDRKSEIAVRVHDECNGSDVFGTDICTCRPYLIFALKICIEVAQRGGVGIIVYFRKEGRSLGEVTKYRVYNARRNQAGGDTAEQYFYQTESIAGVTDARFQVMMPDVLHWLGIHHIDWLISMSSEKYDAITKIARIKVNQRVSLPDSYVPKHANVELTAKIMRGYYMDQLKVDFNEEKSDQLTSDLRNLKSIRVQCSKIYRLALENKLEYFILNNNKLNYATDTVMNCINKHYPKHDIPLHSRFRHFDKNRIGILINKWNKFNVDKIEQCRRLIDLVTISVLLDAGAGPDWSYIDAYDTKYTRSEGLAIASYDMFMNGLFSSDAALKERVNSLGLKNLTVNQLKLAFQVTKLNPMIGLEGRANVIRKLGKAMENNPQYFGYEMARPGNILDYCLRHARTSGQNVDENDPNSKYKVSIHTLWKGIIFGMESIWPGKMKGVARGDVWRYGPIVERGKPGSDLIPFHKLQQWLCYSLIEAISVYFDKIEFLNLKDMTALAEYRNGGLFMDTGVLTLRPEIDSTKCYDVGSELIVEFRAMTIMLADQLAIEIRKRMNKTEDQLPLSNVLEGGIWRAGRELAFKLRNGTPPINIRRDGTVF